MWRNKAPLRDDFFNDEKVAYCCAGMVVHLRNLAYFLPIARWLYFFHFVSVYFGCALIFS